jgi:CheY-like chemotaxis protein
MRPSAGKAPSRRKHPRITLPGPIVARLSAGREGRIRDLSAGGLRLEHEGILWPQERCLLQFALNDELYTFSGRVIWSRALDPPGAGSGLGFQSGVVFEGIPGAAKPLLAQLLEGGRSRLLVVEDEPSMREVLASALAKAGYEVHEAVDGPQGVEKAQQIIPDLILLDVRLPGLDGFEVCRSLKEHPATRRIPVIFLTAVDDRALHYHATAAGGTACLTKPFRLEVLIALTKTVIENARR